MGEPSGSTDYVGPSIVLINERAVVPVPIGAITSLISFALAGPSNEASTKVRDEAIDAAHAAIVAHYEATR